jgi:hypothetical protein
MSEKANEIIRMVSEEIIAERRETVQRLREIRSDLEYIFTGMLK